MQDVPPSEGRKTHPEVPQASPEGARVGQFVPFRPDRTHRNSAKVGWIVAENGCHIWQGAKAGQGYGAVWANGRLHKVHRLRYEREIGPIPKGMYLDHYICDAGPKGCCNPHHCRPATPRENSLRGDTLAATCAARTHCHKGHELSGDNLDPYALREHGKRKCKACGREHSRAYVARKKAA